MFWTVVAFGTALLVPPVVGGTYARLFEKPWRWGSFLVAAIAIQLVVDVVSMPNWSIDVGFGLLVGSYVLLLGFVGRNAIFTGMGVVFIGVAVNALALTVNHGTMADSLVVVHGPSDEVLSFGHLIMAVGLCDVAFHASRSMRRRRSATRASVVRPRAPGRVIDLRDEPDVVLGAVDEVPSRRVPASMSSR